MKNISILSNPIGISSVAVAISVGYFVGKKYGIGWGIGASIGTIVLILVIIFSRMGIDWNNPFGKK